MLKQYDDNITFELNETLSFELGQEIDELISISLDPDIIIQSYEDYIQIRGVIALSGQYYRSNKPFQPNLEPRTERTFRYVEKVINESNHISNFSHRFPVEISVSKQRVDDIEDITVTVDSFDYELPASNSLQVYASLHIYGINPEQADKRNEAQEAFTGENFSKTDLAEQSQAVNKDRQETVNSDKQRERSVEASNRYDSEKNDQDKFQAAANSNNNKDSDVSETSVTPALSGTAKKSTPITEESDETTETHSKSTAFENDTLETEEMATDSEGEEERTSEDTQETTKIKNNEKIININEHRKAKQTEIKQENEPNADSEGVNSTDEEQDDDTIQVELSDGLEEDEADVADLTFLTELFEEEEETYTQVKIYIAQNDDTLEGIAKRYDIPVLQLLKDNQMSIDSIEEGQLITIKQRRKQSK